MMNHEIKDIIKLYNSILSERRVFTEQVDIFGIDELVYNPATKKGGDIGYGYDRGKKRPGITWGGHWGHLHIGFTDKDVAIDVINYADSLGLRTAENLIAKKDRTGYIEDEHDGSSFHYRLFPGEPKVTAGVDITGSHSKIVELMNWIIEKYAKDGGYSYANPNFLSMDWQGLTKLVPIYKGKPIIDKNLAISASIPAILSTMSANAGMTEPEIKVVQVEKGPVTAEDKIFYENLLKSLGAPMSDENLKFLYAWRQSEGQGGNFNPFNTTWELDNSTDMNSAGVQHYQSAEDGMKATLKTLNNGRYNCIVAGLQNDIGAAEIAKCPSLKVWGTGDLVSKVISYYDKGNPVKIAPLSIGEYSIQGTDQTSPYEEPIGQSSIEVDDDGDPILKLMAQSIFKEDNRKKNKLLENINRIKGLI